MTINAKNRLKRLIDNLTESEAHQLLEDLSRSDIEWIPPDEIASSFDTVRDEFSSAFRRLSDA